MNNIIKNISILVLLLVSGNLIAQPTIYPAKPQSKPISIVGATIHVGNGQVIEKGTITFSDGKITYVGTASTVTGETIDATGKHIYPGFIAANTNLGLVEFSSVKATLDFAEVGDNNSHIRTIAAYNTDSKVINTLRSNGVLLAQITPQRGLISGQSSVVQLDGWNWEDAVYKMDDGIHINWPELRISRFAPVASIDKQKEAVQKQVSELVSFIAQAKAYTDLGNKDVTNARFDAFEGITEGSKKIFVHVNDGNSIIAAVNTFKSLGITPVIVGGRDAHLVASVLKDNQVPVLIRESHSLPSREGEDVNLPYKQAKILSDAGVLAAYAMDGFWQQRNLPFMAGTAAAHGLDKEEALSYITLNTAKILGVDARTGSLEVGKDANLFVSKGDALDMLGNDVEHAFIMGKDIDLNNLHKQLFERYEQKYSSY